MPDIPGLAESGYLTSDTMWDALRGRDDDAGRGSSIIGGGPIGTELAQAFARLGAKVTQIEHGERLLAEGGRGGFGADRPDTSRAKAWRSSPATRRCASKARRLIVRVGSRRAIDPLRRDHRRGRPQGAADRLRARGARASRPARRSSPTTGWRRSTPTSTRSATSPAPINSPISPPTRPGSRRSTRLFGQLEALPRRLSGPCPGSPSPIPRSPMSAITSSRRRRRASPTKSVRYDLSHLDRAVAEGAQSRLRQAARRSRARTGFSARPSSPTMPASCSPRSCWR